MAVGNSLTGRYSQVCREVAAGVTVTPITPVGLDSNALVQLAMSATGSQVIAMGFPESSGAGTKTQGSGIFTHVNIATRGKRMYSGWGFTAGLPVYVSRAAAGALTQIAPNINGDLVQQVATATDDDEILIDIHQPNYVGD